MNFLGIHRQRAEQFGSIRVFESTSGATCPVIYKVNYGLGIVQLSSTIHEAVITLTLGDFVRLGKALVAMDRVFQTLEGMFQDSLGQTERLSVRLMVELTDSEDAVLPYTFGETERLRQAFAKEIFFNGGLTVWQVDPEKVESIARLIDGELVDLSAVTSSTTV